MEHYLQKEIQVRLRKYILEKFHGFKEEYNMLTVRSLQQMKEKQEKITMVTAYDFPSAKQAETAGVDTILVGDSLGMTVMGYESTTQVTLNDMIHHAKAVKRGAPNTFIIVDMPFMSYHTSIEKSIQNAITLFPSSNAHALKVEGGSKEILELVGRLTDGGIPVIGHLGLTPQSVNVLGGYRVQGNDEAASNKLLEDAKKLEAAGAVMIVFECIPKELTEIITSALYIPTIGIGAVLKADGQVLVYHDILQYGVDRLPKFVQHYADFNHVGVEAIKQYVDNVKQASFPEDKHSYTIKDEAFLPKL